MMLRRAVIQQLKDNVPGLDGRVYEAFLAPPNVSKPNCTVKVSASRGSGIIAYAGTQPVEIRIYARQESFKLLDEIEQGIVECLNGIEITDQNDGEKYCLTWVPGGGDFIDEDKKLIGRLILFEAAILFERS